MFVARSAKYPYVSRETWFTRFWLLHRKISAAREITENDRRVARAMLYFMHRVAPAEWQVQWLLDLTVEAVYGDWALVVKGSGPEKTSS